MTDEQILSLVEEHFTEGGIQDDGSCNEWYGNTYAFLKFAQLMYDKGRDDEAELYVDENY